MSLAIDARFADQVLRDEPLSRHTSWHVGGPADVFFMPRDREQLVDFLRALPAATPLLWLGLGSNLLVRDGGIRGVVIATQDALTRLERRGDLGVYVEAGVPCALVARQCARWELGPAAFLAGIPGTMGGALAMNAGAFGGETWPLVRSVETVDRDGTLRTRAADEYATAYRSVTAPVEGEWFLAATLELQPRPDETPIRALLERRRQTQPIGEWSCGSVFTNPPGDHAARLIEACGLKGLRIGDATVSEKHANFIVNDGEASAQDIETLIARVRATVQEKFGVLLHPEVRVVGEAA
ncbi:MAG: UDP-N-acetylmuramate dehydrogenase [Steroidobacteraceae bacterium]